MSLEATLTRLLAPTAGSSAESVGAFLREAGDRTRDLTREADRALLGGRLADRLGFAFAAGYQAALRALFGERARAGLSLAATEAGGAHPRAISTALVPAADGGFVLDGEKVWITLADQAASFVVIAREGEAAGRPLLRAAIVPKDRDGVALHPLPAPPFCPEIEHARVTFSNVRVRSDDLLEGDGYERYLKPFRTVEDTHVLCAVVGYVLGVARDDAVGRALTERLAALAVTARACALEDPTSAPLHVALGGVFAELGALEPEIEAALQRAGRDAHGRWVRDKGLLGVAARARAQRLARAWERLER